MLADYLADWGTKVPQAGQTEKPADSSTDGLSDVVEMRRLELLTPYMRKRAKRKKANKPERS